MESRAKLFGHPIHPMLIPFPLGLLATSLAFDLVRLLAGGEPWAEVAYWMIAAGIIGGLLAQQLEPSHAAAWGVYLHGSSGDRLAEHVGPLGFLARELLAEIPALMAELSRPARPARFR